MSYPKIRKLLETHLATMASVLPTAWQNVAFTPTPGTAYQRAFLLPAPSEAPALGTIRGSGDHLVREVGVFQVSLYYPEGSGPGAAEAMAELVRNRFYRGLVLTDTNTRVLLEGEPSLGPSRPDGGFHVQPLSIPYRADVFV